MEALQQLLAQVPDAAKDVRLNVASVLAQSTLTPQQKWGVAAAVAATTRCEPLRAAVFAAASAEVEAAVLDDAVAAAAIMAMNNVYYRFRHFVDADAYAQMAPRLRMQRLAKPATNKADFELFALAVSAVNGCSACVHAHERAVLDGGLSREQVHDAVRIAAVVQSAAVALSLGGVQAA